MTEPLSIAAGIAGVIKAAADISSLLKRLKDAPQAARTVLAEVDEIGETLKHLRSFLLDKQYFDSSRTQLLQVDHFITIMGGCVFTFSELEKLLDGLRMDSMGLLDRVH